MNAQTTRVWDDRRRDHSLKENGAGEAIRTPDPNLGKVVLYP